MYCFSHFPLKKKNLTKPKNRINGEHSTELLACLGVGVLFLYFLKHKRTSEQAGESQDSFHLLPRQIKEKLQKVVSSIPSTFIWGQENKQVALPHASPRPPESPRVQGGGGK